MRTTIQKWGKSLALRIPEDFAERSHIEQGTPVDVKFVEGKIVIIPIEPNTYELDDLLAQVTDENIHRELDFGNTLGEENW